MIYKFKCPCCGDKAEIDMPMKFYTSIGHMCKKCGAELERDYLDIAGGIQWKTGGNFGKSE